MRETYDNFRRDEEFMIELSQLMVGDQGKIYQIADDLEVKRRLLDLGFTKGSQVECVLSSSFGGPFAYKIKNSVVAIRRGDARKILVERVLG